VKYRRKNVEQLTGLNKLYSVPSCWIIIAILYDARSTERKKKNEKGVDRKDPLLFEVLSLHASKNTEEIMETDRTAGLRTEI